jgi:endonuclease/exonuclease/phosphatase family metal-dependent hydrolase
LISHLVLLKRRWRRIFSRTRWVARLLNRDLSAPHSDEPGLIIIQVDGLARDQLEKAIKSGRMPFLKRLISQGHFDRMSFYSGLPSTTPAVQAEVMFGAKCAVPAFQFLHRKSGRTVLMYEQEWAKRISDELSKEHSPLLQGGRSYSNIYAAGAAEARFCAETMDLANVLEMTRPWKLAVVFMLYGFTILRILGLAILELFIALYDMVRGLAGQQHWRAELHCIPSRIGVSIVMREWLRIMFKLAIAEGTPIVYGNFLGYDEQAHRRGPSSDFAHWGLKGIDDMIRDIFRAAHTSDVRDYEVVIFSDHGQEHTEIFENARGITIQEAVTRAFASGPLQGRSVRGLDDYQGHGPETDQRGRRLLRMKKGQQTPPQATPDELLHGIIVTALGPLGHVYLPVELSDDELCSHARALVDQEKVPLVIVRNQHSQVVAHNARGRFSLTDNAADIFGADHPFLVEIAADLMRLVNHPDAGDLILSGWNPDQMPSTFVQENGAHGSIGYQETRGFALLPHTLPIHYRQSPNHERYIRGVDLYRAAWRFVHHDQPLSSHPTHDDLDQLIHNASSQPKLDHLPTLRVMTYNIHSCIGVDGKIRPERIISVIKSCGADIIALQEVDAGKARTRGHEQAKMIADALAMSHHYYAISDWSGEQYGLAIVSRFPIEHIKSGYLTPANHRTRSEPRGAHWVKVETPQGHVNVINTHFGLRREEREQQTQLLLGDDWLKQIPADEPIVLCGDFNAGPKSDIYKQLARTLMDVQTFSPHHRPRATFASILPVRRIDHIFVSKHFEVRAAHRPRTPTAKVASDHLPVCASLTPRAVQKNSAASSSEPSQSLPSTIL